MTHVADAPQRPTVTVVIPTLNEERMLPGCLAALAAQTEPVDEIVVVDNNCTDRTAEIALAAGARVITESQAGITYARTAGFDAATSDIIARIDADTLVSTNWAETIRDAFAADPGLDAVAGGAAVAEVSPRGRYWFTIHYSAFRFWHERSIGVRPMIYGFNGAIRREAWASIRDRISLGDQQISEDVDVTICLLASGKRVQYLPKLVVKAHLFRSLKPGKLSQYYRTDSETLRRHSYGNPKRWARDADGTPAG